MKTKITKTIQVIESWIEKNGKKVETFPIKKSENIEREIEEENFVISFNDGSQANASFPENKVDNCYNCQEQKKVVLLIKYVKNGRGSNWNYCFDCALKEISDDGDISNPEVLTEIKETIIYKNKLHNEKKENSF